MTSVGFVGAGLIGGERIKAFAALAAEGVLLRAAGVVDPFNPKVDGLGASIGAPALGSVEALIDAGPDLVVVATPHDTALDVAGELLDAGIRVLLEKPLGRTLEEATALAARQKYAGQLSVGYNFRFFEGIRLFMDDLRKGAFGRPISLTFTLGHGGAPQDLKGWKLDPVRAGGGCLIDPGVHLLDLACQAEPREIEFRGGNTWSGFWNTGIEEDCHLILAGCTIPTIQVNASIVRWRSTFRIECFGTEKYGIVEGRGRSYGPQTYRRGTRWAWRQGKPQMETEELVVTTSGDKVFIDELRALLLPREGHAASVATAAEAVRVMELLERCRTALGLRSSSARLTRSP